MAAFGQLKLTDLGIMAQLNAQDGKPLKFTKIGVGSGVYNGDVSQITKLVKEEVLVGIDNAYMEDNVYTVSGSFSNENLETSFVWREIGLYFEDDEGNNVLYSYANAGERYDYIPATTDARYTKTVRVATAISNAENVSIQSSSGTIYVEVAPYEAFKKKVEDHIAAVPSSVVNRWTEHGGDSVVEKSLIETITDKINNEGILSGEFTFFNILYSDGCPGCTAYGLIKYTRHLDNYVTVHMLSENQGVDWQYARFVLGETAWDKDWVGYAPSGYGYGDALPTVTGSTDAEFLANIEALCAEKVNFSTFQVILYPPGDAFDGNSFVAQIFHNANSSGKKFIKIKAHAITSTSVFQRVCYGSVWSEPEWENPPMTLGVEYRTTERYNGHVVYVMLVNFGEIPLNGTQKQVGHFATGIKKIVGKECQFTIIQTGEVYSEGVSEINQIVVTSYYGSGRILMGSASDANTPMTATCCIRYTKS